MQFTNTALLALLAVLPAFTTAAPTEIVESEVDLAKRVQTKETVYLTNCGSVSQFSYYKAGHNSEDRSPPDDVCIFNTGNNSPIIWENAKRSCTFTSSGVNFESDIGGEVAINDFAGPGTQRVPGKNPKRFDCFKDNQRVLYHKNGVDCGAFYWCNPR
jgi:hypothetical protein